MIPATISLESLADTLAGFSIVAIKGEQQRVANRQFWDDRDAIRAAKKLIRNGRADSVRVVDAGGEVIFSR